jgi:glycosyltransferase involved in cell wall biosynthesis
MRVALITNSLPPEPATGGAQDYVAALATSLAERHNVLVISGARDSSVEGVECVRVPALRTLLPWDSIPSKAIWHLRDQWMPSVHAAVATQLDRFAPAVIHTHELQGISSAPFTAVARTATPHVHTAHDLNLLCVRVTMTRNGEFCGGRCLDCRIQRGIRGRLVRAKLHRLITPSDRYRELHLAAGIVPPERALTIRHGAPAGSTRVRRVRGAPHIGFIGALSPHKGIRTLIDALGRAPDDWQLSIAGDGWLEGEVRAAATQDPRITFHGYVKGAAKDEFYDALDLVVIPSEWEEAATLVAVEAAVRGLPSVVSDRGGLPETPQARVFPAHDRDALLDAIRWFVDDESRLSHASERLLANREQYLWPTHVSRVEQVLEAAAAEPIR